MITTSERRRSTVLEIALLLSLFVHVAGGVLYLLFAPRFALPVQPIRPDDVAALSDVIRLEKRPVPRVAVRQPPAVAQPPRTAAKSPARTVVPPAAPPPRPDLYRQRSPATPVPDERGTPAPNVAYAPPAKLAERDPSVISSEQLSQLNARFANAIARTKADLENVPLPTSPPAARKRFQAIMSGSLRDLQRAQGIVERVYREGHERGMNWYYLQVRITYPDGFTELVDVPWRLYFPARDDPILEASGRLFVPPPPPDDYRLPNPFPFSRFVCLYYHDACQALMEKEERSGGPVSN